MPSLFVIQGRDQGRRFELTEQLIGIGRDASNSIRLCDTEVSRRHAELVWLDETYQLLDLNSSNGTYVNSQRITRSNLQSGDRIQLGQTLLIFTAAPPGPQAHAPSRDLDIVVGESSSDISRIISSVGQDPDSQQLVSSDALPNPWLARARSNLQIMYRTALAVSHTLDIDQLLERIMELIFEWVECDRGCIMLLQRETGELAPKVRRDRQGNRSQHRMTISRTILDYVISRQEGVITSNARDDERWETAASIVKLGVREAICVPMQGRYGTVGAIYIDTFTPPGQILRPASGNRFSQEHLKLMVAIGHQAALAIEDTCYYSALLQAERLAAIGQTIAGLSHHIKNILQGIRGGSYLIEEGLKANDAELTRKGWRIVEKNQERISQLVMDMLTFSKERRPEMTANNLNDVVGDVLELIQTRADEAKVRVIDDRAQDMPPMTFDHEAIHRAVLNIVMNAVEACEAVEDGTVRVATEYDADQRQLRVVVEDNGPGIDPEDQKRIFALFESKKGHRGTGLGLAVSQKILEEHSGQIRVESEAGAGSRFILQLPAVAPECLSYDTQGSDQLPEPIHNSVQADSGRDHPGLSPRES